MSTEEATEEDEFNWALGQLSELRGVSKSCVLSTVSTKGDPLASYAPVLIDNDFRLYVYVSGLAKHYAHLRKTGRASVMLIEDESSAENLFARKRLTVDCEALLIDRESERWGRIIPQMRERLGETMGYLKDMKDFDLFELSPSEGRLVLGFGKAYRVWGDGLKEIGYVGAGGHRSNR